MIDPSKFDFEKFSGELLYENSEYLLKSLYSGNPEEERIVMAIFELGRKIGRIDVAKVIEKALKENLK